MQWDNSFYFNLTNSGKKKAEPLSLCILEYGKTLKAMRHNNMAACIGVHFNSLIGKFVSLLTFVLFIFSGNWRHLRKCTLLIQRLRHKGLLQH